MRTIRALDEAGLDLRAWCYRCARGERIDSLIWRRFEAKGWDDTLPAAAARFRCKECRGRDVLIVAATRPPPALSAPTELVAAYFHGMRAEAKRRRRGGDEAIDRIVRAMLERGRLNE